MEYGTIRPIILRKELNTAHNVHEPYQPRCAENQDAFCTALFQLLLKKPLEKISVTELCHMADLDRTTFYRSFESKDDVLDYYLRPADDPACGAAAGVQYPGKKPDCAVPLDVCGAKEPLCPDGLPSDQFFPVMR